jgi:thermitase
MPYHYKVAGETVSLDVDPSVVAVKFADVAPSQRANLLQAMGIGPYSQRIDLPREGLSILPAVPPSGFAPSAASEARRAGILRALESDAGVVEAKPVFRIGGNQAVATNRVILGVSDNASADALLQQLQLVKVSRSAERLVAEVPEGADVFEVVRAAEDAPGVLYAEPDFLIVGRHLPKRAAADFPIVPAAVTSTQYAMKITKAEQAWAVQAGDPAVRIAILDEGVDTAHPDLAPQVVGSFDAIDGDTYQQPNPWDGHGTACAGLAAGAAAGPGGVQGSGRGCSILAVRIAFSGNQGGPWQTSNQIIASAIDWATVNGASVISNSWGGGLPSNAIIFAIDRARAQGRGGLGCVVVIAAGNEFGPVQFPANVPGVLAVAASNEYDQAKTPDSADGETWWGSCFGPEIDVAAPGVHNLITDITGSGGYAPGNYAPTFNGTSSATPIVAGACGLILSGSPNLPEATVRHIIRATADPVGQFPYPGGRNDHMGSGRLNVLAAIQHP